MHNEIRTLIRQRKRLYKKAKLKKDEKSWDLFRKKRNEVVASVKKAKKTYLNKLTKKAGETHNSPKTWWKINKTLLKSNKTTEIPFLFHNDVFYENAKDKAKVFNDFFASQSDLDDSGHTLNEQISDDNSINTLDNIVLTKEVHDVLKSLNTTKSSGPDLISPKMLKMGADELAYPLSKLFNLSLQESKFPIHWKEANVTPVHKKENKSIVNNYRPISLLSCIGKVFERCVHKHLHNFLRDNNTITKFQSGFTQGDSTTNQLLDIYNTFSSALDSGNEARVIFFRY